MFIDKHITCKRDEEAEMKELINYQVHKHSHTCLKGGRSINNCRFSYPKPPLPATKILHPLPNDISKKKKKEAQETFQKIWLKLNEMGSSFKDDINFQTFLDSMEITEVQYFLAIRSSIKRSTVFLKRRTNEIFINGYNKKILIAWKANMDIQYVLDTYACAKYCVSYISKAEGGVSKLLRAAAADAKKGNTSIQEKLQQFAKILINGTEISAQEAVLFLLGLPNTYCNRANIYINTAPASQRIGLLKSEEELAKLSDDSEDVCEKGLLDHYTQRPEELEEICLAEFSSLYQFSKKNSSKKNGGKKMCLHY